MYKKYCLVCDNFFINKEAIFCPICGSKNFKWMVGKMFYEGIEVDKDSKAIVCPVCNNEDSIEGDYCSICGTYIVNKCTNDDYPGRSEYDEDICGKLLTGNSRFCPYCGAESTFHRDKLLKPWDESIHDDNGLSNDLNDFVDDIFQSVENNVFTPIYDDDDDDDIPF